MVLRYARLPLIVLVALVFALTTDGRSTHTSVHAVEQIHNLSASKDNTLYESASGLLSNGAGTYLFVGRTGQPSNSIRRGVIAFDVAGAVPAGSTILSATLSLQMTRTPLTVPRTVELRRLLDDWGEGTSNDTGQEGSGALATAGSATWIHTFFSASTWSSAGGDFSATASASQAVGANGSYSWSSAQMANDVQDWLDNPSNNFGWLLLGDETISRTAKRFNTRENGIAPPVLSLKVSEPTPAATPTPTVPPIPVGGFSQELDVPPAPLDSEPPGGGTEFFATAGAVAAGLTTLTAVAWYVRRRR